MIPRYTREEMAQIWSEENRFRWWLEIEILLLEYLANKNIIPPETPQNLRKKAKINLERIRELEKINRHEVIAFVESILEQVGEDGRYLHFGLTSSDLMDTGLCCQIKEAGEILLKDMEKLENVLRKKAVEFKYTPMMGRTHGMHAEPITLGVKFARWWEETKRNRERLRKALENARYGKISGAVGTYTHLEPEAEEFILSRLGLKREPVSSQILPRDRFAELLLTFSLIATSLEEFSLEIRHLQRTEVGELEEPFTPGQKGSSAMPHKRNPILCERICGLARLLRGYALASLENIPLWHERDISHSSVERIIIPDSFILLDYLLTKFSWIMENLKVNKEKMMENLKASGEIFYSQKLMLTLVEEGMDRKKAYELVQGLAMESLNTGVSFREKVFENSEIKKLIPREKLKRIFNLDSLLERIDDIFSRIGLE
ncbi:adenylosuccinate lyase [Candidatus Calescamantes bacterium]|nr:adenylosuccinate lyase [Candidatus Calescamantes bacterium]